MIQYLQLYSAGPSGLFSTGAGVVIQYLWLYSAGPSGLFSTGAGGAASDTTVTRTNTSRCSDTVLTIIFCWSIGTIFYGSWWRSE